MKIILKVEDSGKNNYVISNSCPIARALRRKGYRNINVSTSKWEAWYLGIIPMTGRISYQANELARQWTYIKQSENLIVKLN